MKKIMLLLLLVCAFFESSFAAEGVKVENEGLTASQIEEIEKIRPEIEKLVDSFLISASKNIIPSKSKPQVEELGNNKIRVVYIDFDRENVVIDIYPAESKTAKYYAKIKYKEYHYKAEKDKDAKFVEEAFTVSFVRNITEIARYDKGKWHY